MTHYVTINYGLSHSYLAEVSSLFQLFNCRCLLFSLQPPSAHITAALAEFGVNPALLSA